MSLSQMRRIKIQAEDSFKQESDGHVYFCPKPNMTFSASTLRMIADILDEKNQEAT